MPGMPGIYSRKVRSQQHAARAASMLVFCDESFQYQLDTDEYVFTVPEHRKKALDIVIDDIEGR
jgi:hypothetical protein